MHELTICKSNLSLVLPIGRYPDFSYIRFIAYVIPFHRMMKQNLPNLSLTQQIEVFKVELNDPEYR